MKFTLFALCLCSSVVLADPPPVNPNIGHNHHLHCHGEKNETVEPTAERFDTSRKSPVKLPLPNEKDASTSAAATAQRTSTTLSSKATSTTSAPSASSTPSTSALAHTTWSPVASTCPTAFSTTPIS
ncbi:hypothetical protein N9Z15_06095, partial [Akkermansiaceae bacterium]|nr:hypothetical protein [Akkermansiaceae bacterium]